MLKMLRPRKYFFKTKIKFQEIQTMYMMKNIQHSLNAV